MNFVHESVVPTAAVEHLLLPLMADVEFGILNKNGDCVNIGICKINTSIRSANAPSRCRHALARLGVTIRGTLIMCFERKGLLPCTERAIFRLLAFPIPASFIIPDTVRAALPELSQAVIAPGRYPIRSTKDAYFIEF
jgi:hypothetical protein